MFIYVSFILRMLPVKRANFGFVACFRIQLPQTSNIHWRDLIPMIKMDIASVSKTFIFDNILN